MAPLYSPTEDSRDLSLLVPEMREKVEALILACAVRNLRMQPFYTLRGPEIQGKLWCQSRTVEEVQARRSTLELARAPIIASYLDVDFANTGRWATNALPGMSWHQWGEAVDCVIVVGGAAVWVSGMYASVYGAEAKKLGLTPGALWTTARDPVHVQLRRASNPMTGELTTWAELEKKLGEVYDLGRMPT